MTRAIAVLAAADVAVLAIGRGPVALLHVALAIAGYALWMRGTQRRDFATAILGVFGPVALLLVSQIVRRLPHRTQAVADLPEPVQRPTRARRGATLAAARMLDGRVMHAAPDTLDSLVTVMRHGEVAQRRLALETVVRSFQPALSPLVALALTDGDQTIRALAAAASARVVQNLALARTALETRGDHAALAALLADHARANVLLSDTQRSHLRDDALALMPADTTDPARIEALWAAGDYAAIDALVGTLPDRRPTPGHPMEAATAWWRAGQAA